MQDHLTTAIRAARTKLSEQFETATAAASGHDARREVQELTDTFLIRTCQHVSAICDVVLPVAGKKLHQGSALVDEYVDQARHFEQAVVHTKRRLYGEIHSVSAPWSQVLTRLGDEYQRLADLESALVASLADAIDPTQLKALAEKAGMFERTAPTRPHPHSPHVGRLAHLSRGFWSRADRFWDAAEGRVSTAVSRTQARLAS